MQKNNSFNTSNPNLQPSNQVQSVARAKANGKSKESIADLQSSGL